MHIIYSQIYSHDVKTDFCDLCLILWYSDGKCTYSVVCVPCFIYVIHRQRPYGI